MKVLVVVASWILIALGILESILLCFGITIFSASYLYDWTFVWPFVFILAGIGLLNFQEWVRRLFIVYLLISIPVNLGVAGPVFLSETYKHGNSPIEAGAKVIVLLWFLAVFVLPYLLTLLLLNLPKVKELFKEKMAEGKLKGTRLPVFSFTLGVVIGLGLVYVPYFHSESLPLAIGNLYFDRSDFKRAYKYYSKIPLDDDSMDYKRIQLYYNLAVCSSHLNMPDKAIEYYKKIFDLSNESLGIIHHNIGSAYMESGKYEKALEEFDQAIKYGPDYFNANQNKAVTYRYMGRYMDSVKACQNVIDRFPNFSMPHCSQGWAYEKLGDYEKAAQAHLKAIAMTPYWKFPRQRLQECLKNIKAENVRAEILKKLDEIDKTPIKTDSSFKVDMEY